MGPIEFINKMSASPSTTTPVTRELEEGELILCEQCNEDPVEKQGLWCQTCLFIVLHPGCKQFEKCAPRGECMCRLCEQCGDQLSAAVNYVCDNCYETLANSIPAEQRHQLDKKRKRQHNDDDDSMAVANKSAKKNVVDLTTTN